MKNTAVVGFSRGVETCGEEEKKNRYKRSKVLVGVTGRGTKVIDKMLRKVTKGHVKSELAQIWYDRGI